MGEKFDFSGWATKNNIRCSDGRTIMKDAFAGNDGMTVPLVYGHNHGDIFNVLGHALLENRNEGVYCYGKFNDTEEGQHAKKSVENGDIRALSIYANQLRQNGGDVVHGQIREVSLVLAGANPGARIESILAHEDGSDESAIIYTGEEFELAHAEEPKEEKKEEKEPVAEEKKEKTVGDVFDELTEEQKNVVYALIGQALEDNKSGEGEKEMKHNVFEGDNMDQQNVLSHADQAAIIADAKRLGSMKDAFLAHAEASGYDIEAGPYGVEPIDWLYPEDRNIKPGAPEFIKRDTGWVSVVMNGVHHTPFSRIKSQFADITEDEARAKGYIKGNLKKNEVFSLLKRRTDPQTIYKKQKMDRDDMIDITDFDVIAWLKGEMRMMLDEEIARAILIGDGRLTSDDDHISEDHIRPVVNEADLFAIRWSVKQGANSDEFAKNFIRAAIKSRKNYKGSGNPVLFTTEDILTDLLLLEDGIGHKLYKTEGELATALRVSRIVTVPVMEGAQDKDNKEIYAVILNLNDYNVGADKGGAVNMFDDFDIDYNQYKYLIETRCSGALIKPFSAIILREGTDTVSEEPTLQQAMAPYKKQNDSASH